MPTTSDQTLEPRTGADPSSPADHADPALQDALTCSVDELVERLGDQLQRGLSTAESAARLRIYGRNELPVEPPRPAWKRFAIDSYSYGTRANGGTWRSGRRDAQPARSTSAAQPAASHDFGTRRT